MWRYRGRSPSFRFRFKRLLQLGLLRHGKFSRFGAAYWNPRTSPLYCVAWGSAPLRWVDRRISICEELVRVVGEVNPDLIIYPSSAYDPDGNDLARISRIMGIPALFLIDNWDNLSSKTIFWAYPNHLGVWGQQSKEHAIRIQGFKPEQVTPIGTPRFDEYYGPKPPSPFEFKYALFVGQAIAFDELTPLRIIEQCIERSHDDIKVVYRPHPWRQARLCDDRFDEAKFQHIILDPQVKSAYYKKDHGFQPDLKYYPALVKNAEFVVATPTTMLMEALVCHKQVLLLAYDDGIHLTTPANSLTNYEHFKGVTELEGVKPCWYEHQLAWLFRNMGSDEVNPDLSYYLFNDGRPYRKRLNDLVRRLNVKET